MGELASALEALASHDLYAMNAGGLLERTAELVRARNRIDAELARTVRRAELVQASEHDGLKTMASWLRGHARLSPAAAGQLVRNGRVLESLSAVAAACATGAVTAEQVTVIAPVVKPANFTAAAEQGVDLDQVAVVLAETAATRQHAHLVQVVQHYLSRLDPDGVEPDPTEGRSMTLAKHSEGSVSGRFELDAVGGEKVQAALEAFVQADRPKGDRRTRAQQLGDALVQLADVALASGDLPILRTVKPHVTVLIDIDDLADPATGPAAARTGFGAQISAARARWLACDGNIARIVIGPEDQPVNLGRSKRVVPPTCAVQSSYQTPTASSPGAQRPTTGATSTMLSNGCSTTEKPRCRTPRFCANGTTPSATTDSGWNDNPTADGALTAPTTPRSSPLNRPEWRTDACRRPSPGRQRPSAT